MEETTQNTSTELPPKLTKADFEPSNTKRDQFQIYTKAVLYTLLSSFLIAFAAHTLITPNKFTIGGASGIAILIYLATGFPQSAALICINLPLIILSFFFVKKKFAVLSALNIGLQSIWLLIMESFFPNLQIVFPGGEASKLLAALASGVCVGFAIALAFKIGGSTGGTDILAVMIQKKFKATSISWMLFIINCIVIGLSVFVIPSDENATDTTATYLGTLLLPAALAAFEAFIESKTNESVSSGFQAAIEFRIITDKPEEMSMAIMKELSRGVTAVPATGMYTKISHTMLICVVSRRQVTTLQRIMKHVDSDSFAVTSRATQVLGLGFYTGDVN